MRVRLVRQAVLGIVLICQFSACLGTETPDPNDSSKYLNAVRTFADNVLKYGRDTYGPKHTPLFVDGLNIHTHEPVKWVTPDGEEWVLSNLSSQQNLFRTLDGLSKVTGDPKYRKAAEEAVRYAFENLQSPSGLFYWGGHAAYDAQADEPCGRKTHELKGFYPYYELMWEVNPKATRQFIEAFWAGHILDWSSLSMNRHYYEMSKPLKRSWDHDYNPAPVFEGIGFSPSSTGADMYYAAAWLSIFTGEKKPLTWSKRLAYRYVETRHPNTGISARVFTGTGVQSNDEVLGKLKPVPYTFPWQGHANKSLWESHFGYDTPIPGTMINRVTAPWICQLMLAELLGGDVKEFIQWPLEELTAWGKVAYREEDNTFVPMCHDGTVVEGYVCKRDFPLGLKGSKLEAVPVKITELWAYTLAHCLTKDAFMWEMARNIALANDCGDLGESLDHQPKLNLQTSLSDPYAMVVFLELHRRTGKEPFLKMGKRIGDNILAHRLYKGFVSPDGQYTFTKFDAIDPLALLHLHAALTGNNSISIPRVWPSTSFFEEAYRSKDAVDDNQLIYSLKGVSKPPRSLQEAAAEGDVKAVKSMIAQGVDVDSREDGFHKTALHRAAMSGHKDVAKLLIDNGARLDARDGWPGGTALDYAVRQNHKEIVDLLRAKVAETSIHGAASLGVLDKVKAFLESGVDVNAKDDQGMTPLHVAAQGGHKEVVEFLLSKDADVKVQNKAGDTPLHSATQPRGIGVEISRLFIDKGTDLNAKNNDGKTPLDLAVTRNRPAVAKLLIEKGTAVFNIHTAAFAGNLEKVQSFIEAGTDVNAQDETGMTPLLRAVSSEQAEVAKFLVDAGADVNGADKRGYVPLHYALWNMDSDMVKLLLEKGADVNAKDTPLGYTPLHWAIMMDGKELTELVLTAGADVKAKSKAGETPLDVAAYGVSTAIGELLVAKGAEVSSLHAAAYVGDLAKVKAFIDEGVEVNRKSGMISGTALHSAAAAGRKEIAEFLIARGADINARDKRGRTPLDLAQKAEHKEMADLLLKQMLVHNVAVTKISAAPSCVQGDTVPVVITVENRGDYSESLAITLTSVTDGTEIGDRTISLPAGGKADLIFDSPATGKQQFGNYVYHGDVNCDGYDDLLVTASRYNECQGRAYLYHGGTDMDVNADMIFTGENTGDYFSEGGWLGDVNGDGVPDVILGALGYNSDQGRVYIYYGGPDMDGNPDVIIDGEPGVAGGFGRTCTTGDVNGDGYEDLFVGAIKYPNGDYTGRIYLYYGGDPMDTNCDLIFTGEKSGDVFGELIDASGDVDGDNLCDLLTAVHFFSHISDARDHGRPNPSGHNRGRAYLYYGGKPMDGVCDVILTGENRHDEFGSGVEVTDIDNDGRADILIAARTCNNFAGRVYLYWGKAKASMSDRADLIFDGERNHSAFGGDDIEVGNINNDDYGDIVIAAYGYPNNVGSGRVYLYHGDTQANMNIDCDRTITFSGRTNFVQFMTIGNFDGDSYGDLVVGGWGYPDGTRQGRVWLCYGGPSKCSGVTFSWNTTNASIGKHTLWVTIDPVAGEEDTADNTMTVEVEVKERSQ